MNNLLLIFIVIGFLAVVLMIEGGYLLWNSHRGSEVRRVQRRLQMLSAGGRLSTESELIKERLLSSTPAIERLLQQVPRVQQLDRLLMQSGLNLTVGRLGSRTAFFAAAGLIVWLMSPLPKWAGPLCVLGAAILPLIHVLRIRRTRLSTIEQQLPDALDLMSRAMRAGHAFPSAVSMVGSDGPQPIAREFAIASDEVNYGILMQDALRNLSLRVPITDLRFFVIAVAIQRETGGNLTEILDKLAALMRARFRLLGTVKVLSAEGKWSGWILSLLPIVLLGVINLINPTFMSILWKDPAGLITLWIGAGLLIAGIIWMWRIVKIHV